MTERIMPEPMISATEISRRVEDLAMDIAASMPSALTVVVQLKGGFVFAADLLRALGRQGVKANIAFLPPGRLETDALGDPAAEFPEIAGQPALLVADVLDTGLHAANAVRLMQAAGAQEIRLCALLDKPARRVSQIEADYVGFSIPNRFVVGYGVDHDENWRFLSYIAAID